MSHSLCNVVTIFIVLTIAFYFVRDHRFTPAKLACDKYCHHIAQRMAHDRRSESKESKFTEDNWMVIKTLLELKWSPEQISGWLKENPKAYGLIKQHLFCKFQSSSMP